MSVCPSSPKILSTDSSCCCQRVVELIALEEVVGRLHCVALPHVQVDDAADRPDSARSPFDPDRDPLLVACVVNAVEQPLREPSAVGGDLHGPTIQSLQMLLLAGFMFGGGIYLSMRIFVEGVY